MDLRVRLSLERFLYNQYSIIYAVPAIYIEIEKINAIKDYIHAQSTKSLGNIRNFAKLAKRWSTKECYNCEGYLYNSSDLR